MFGLQFGQVEATTHWDDGEEWVEFNKKPWLTEWDINVFPHLRDGCLPKELGYRFLEHRPYARTDVYARPFLVWLYLRSCLGVGNALWGTLRTLNRWGIIHRATPEGMMTRLRDLRLGPKR